MKWIRHRYTCVPHPEPSSLLPPPSPYPPSGSSQCTSPKHPVSCIEPGAFKNKDREAFYTDKAGPKALRGLWYLLLFDSSECTAAHHEVIQLLSINFQMSGQVKLNKKNNSTTCGISFIFTLSSFHICQSPCLQQEFHSHC